MVTTNEEKICSRHLDQVIVNGLASEAGLWGRYRRLKQCYLPDPSRTAELAYGLRMYLMNVCNSEVIDVTAGPRAHAMRRIVRA